MDQRQLLTLLAAVTPGLTPHGSLFQITVGFLVGWVDRMLSEADAEEREYLLSALRIRCAETTRPQAVVSVASSATIDAVSVREASSRLYICEESVRRLVRRGVLKTFRKGLGRRNYMVLVSSLTDYQRSMINGNAEVQQN